MNEAECVLAIANGLCQAFRDLATAVLNPRMRAATRYLAPAASGELYVAELDARERCNATFNAWEKRGRSRGGL